MTDSRSFGSIVYPNAGRYSPQSPGWYVCENPDRSFDANAMWRHGDPDDTDLAIMLAAVVDSPGARWVADKMTAPAPTEPQD